VHNRHILPTLLRGLIRNSLKDPRGFRHRLIKGIFVELKRFSSPNIRNIEASEIVGIDKAIVSGGVTREAVGPQYDALLLAALCQVLACKTVFEIGTYHGETAWLLARNKPDARIYTLDLPDIAAASRVKLELTDQDYFRSWNRGVRFNGTPEQDRITQLYGDSAKFDFSPYRGSIDLVFIDASHSYSYVKSDTTAAFEMISERGTIVWDDYTYYPGIFAYLNELAPQLDRSIVHILGTRLATYSRSADYL
jgi:predicted O-methyltransferase YrrM